MTSVSIAMATYNGRQHIRRQLDSLAAQTLIPAELVVTDDGSDDDTISVVDEFAKNAPFAVKVFRNEARLGYRKNFMRAASLCQSELIAFCDQDDYWHPNKIEVSVRPFADSEVLLAYHNADVVTGDGERIGSLAERAPRQQDLPPLSSGPWLHALGFTELFRRSLLQWSDLWPQSLDQDRRDQPLAHDQWFFFLASVFGTIVYIDEPLVAYVQHGSNTYGWGEPGLREFLEKHLRNHSQRFSHVAKAAQRRANILEIAGRTLEGVWAERATIARGYYQALSSHYALRSRLYESASLADRIKAYHAILRNGGYAGGPWTLGRRCLVTDVCPGVFIGHLLPPSTYWLG